MDVQQNAERGWSRGLGDVAIAFKRALYSQPRHAARILSVGGEVVAADRQGERRVRQRRHDLRAVRAVRPDPAARHRSCRRRPASKLPSDRDSRGNNEAFWRAAFGSTFAQDAASAAPGRRWSKCSGARETDGAAEWDVVPQMQVTLNKRQHVMIAGGVRIPLNERDERHTQVLTYLLWDWFDGGFFDFWK